MESWLHTNFTVLKSIKIFESVAYTGFARGAWNLLVVSVDIHLASFHSRFLGIFYPVNANIKDIKGLVYIDPGGLNYEYIS